MHTFLSEKGWQQQFIWQSLSESLFTTPPLGRSFAYPCGPSLKAAQPFAGGEGLNRLCAGGEGSLIMVEVQLLHLLV